MTKLEAYRQLSAAGKETSWIANVFFTRGGAHCAANLKALLTLVRGGRQVSPLPFVMPDERLCVDGAAVTPAGMRALAAAVNL